MKYMGSKNRIAKHILPIMLAEANKQRITTWVEPFVGGGNMIDKVPSMYKRVGYDLNPHTVAALIAIRDMADELPETVSEAEYRMYRGSEPNPITSLIRFGCSFGSRFDEGYARGLQGNHPRNYALETKRNAQKQSPNLQGVEIVSQSYDQIVITEPSLIYCDPPYKGTKWYRANLVPKFNHEEFFQWCRDMKTKGNIVFVSEYNAPEDFELVWQGEVKTNFSSTRKEATHNAVEKLFKV